MKRVLFVDDKPRVLEQLQQMLASRKDQWDMSFALGGEAALTLLAATPYDVVISDISMPGMDGGTDEESVRMLSRHRPNRALRSRGNGNGVTRRDGGPPVSIEAVRP